MKYRITLLIALIVLGGGYFLYSSKESKVVNESLITNESPEKDSLVRTSVQELLANNRKTECVFNLDDEERKISGKLYIDGVKMRGDYTTSDPELGDVEGSVIRDNRFLYVWGESLGETGTKLRVEQAAEDAIDNFVSTDEMIDFDCSFWFVNERLFVPPAEIEFIDISAAGEQGVLFEQQPTAVVDCAFCNAIPNPEAKEECREEFECQ